MTQTTNPLPLEQQIRNMSDQSFASHLITLELHAGNFRSWLCRKPDDSAYWFRITTIPGSLITTGDLGTMVVSRTDDMLPWIRNAVDSTAYFASKCQDTKTREFSEQVLREWIAETQQEIRAGIADDTYVDSKVHQEHLDALDHALSCAADHGPDWFYEELQDVFDRSDAPDWTDWDSQFLWRRDAIRWFIRTYDLQQFELAALPGV